MSYLPLRFEESEIFPQKIIAVRPDVHIMLSQGTLPRKLKRESGTTSPVFELSYSRKSSLHGVVGNIPVELRPGYTCLGFLGEAAGRSEYESGEEVHLYSAWVGPRAFNSFCQSVSGKSNIGFDTFRQGSYSHYNFKSDAREESLKRKLETCFAKEADKLNKLLVESHLLELLSINMERLLCLEQAHEGLSKTDMEQLAYAREILLNRLD